jgi:hypothetical protein
MNTDQRVYVLAEPDGTTTTVRSSAELAERVAAAHEAGICLAFRGTDEHASDSTHDDVCDDHDVYEDHGADEF